MTGTTLITAADAPYFRFAWGLIRSVDVWRRRTGAAMTVIDTGLTEAQRAALTAMDVATVRVGWDFPMPGLASTRREPDKAYTARPHLPTHVPGFETYVWIDADAWVQRSDALDDLVKAAGDADVAVVPELHAAYDAPYDPAHWLHGWHQSVYARALGAAAGADLARRPVFNAGVIAARADSPLWPAWVEAFQASLYQGRYLIVDQVTLNQVIHAGSVTRCLMGAHYNWICNLAPPLWDAEAGQLVEPIAPFAPIGIVHLTGHGRTATEVRTRTGETAARALTWPEAMPPALDVMPTA